MNMALNQARTGHQYLINEDPQVLAFSYLSDPTDPHSSPVTGEITARISHEKSSVSKNAPVPTGISTDLQKYLSYSYTVGKLQEGLILTDSSSTKWKVGKTSELRKFGGIYGYQAPLLEVS